MQLLRIKEVAKRTGLSPSSIYKQIRLGNFPAGSKITDRATGWSSKQVDEWIISKLAINEPEKTSSQSDSEFI